MYTCKELEEDGYFELNRLQREAIEAADAEAQSRFWDDAYDGKHAFIPTEEQLNEIFGPETTAGNNSQGESATGQTDASRARAGIEGGREDGGKGRTETQGSGDGFGLSSYTAGDLQRQAQEAEQYQRDLKRKTEESDRKAQADAERDNFSLTGSDRAADIGAAHGQGGLFDTPAESSSAQNPAHSPENTAETQQNAASSAETITAIDSLIAEGERRRDAGEPPSKRGDSLAYAPPPGDGDYNNPRNWLTENELTRLHELQQSLPSASEDRDAARARIQEKLARRKARAADAPLFSVSGGFHSEVGEAIRAGMEGDRQSLRQQVSLGIKTPAVLQMLGVAEKPVFTNRDLIAKMHIEHGLTKAQLNELPSLLERPAMVFESDTQPGRLLVVTSIVSDGRPVVIAVEPNGKLDRERLEVVMLPSAYPRNDADRQFTRWIKEGKLLYSDKGASRQLATTAKLQLPGVVQRAVGFTPKKYKTDSDLQQYRAERGGAYSFAGQSANAAAIQQQQSGMQPAELEALLRKVLPARLQGKVKVVRTAAELPQGGLLVQDGSGIDGVYLPATGELYLVADAFDSPERALFVLAHELTHYGLRAKFGLEVQDEVLAARSNMLIGKLADAIARDRGMTIATVRRELSERTGLPIEQIGLRTAKYQLQVETAEEALAELNAAIERNDFDYLQQRYGVRVPNIMRNDLRARIGRFVEAIKGWLAKLTGKTADSYSDKQVWDLLAGVREQVQQSSDEAHSGDDGNQYSLSATKSVEANIRRGRESLAKALAEKTSVHRAMFRNGLGWVDFVWGSEGKTKPSGKTSGAMGIAHIIEARMRKDGMAETQSIHLLENLVETIARGKEIRRAERNDSTRAVIAMGNNEAVLVKQTGSNAWMVSGWEVKPDAMSAANDTDKATLRSADSSDRTDGAGFNTSVQQDHDRGNIRYSAAQQQPAPAGFSLPEETKPQAAQRQVQDSMNRWQQVLGTRNRQDESPLSGVVPGLQIRLNQPVSCEPLARVEGSYQPRTRTAAGFSAHGSQTAWPESCAHTSHTRRGALKLRTKAFPA